MPDGPSIPILLALHPWTLKPGEVLGDQTLLRGGLFVVGQASPDCGGGPVYAAECSGGWVKFDPVTGVGVLGPQPPTFDTSYQIRFTGSGSAETQVGFDWTTSKGVGDNGRSYVCKKTNG